MPKIVYCDHHLTAEGWIRGTERWDDGNFRPVNPPSDSALTVRYTAPANRPPYITTQWKTDKEERLNQLIEQYGELPEDLRALAI